MNARNTLKIQTIGMYLMHLPLYAVIVISVLSMDVVLQESITKALLIASLVLMILMIPVCITNMAVTIISVFKGEYDPTKPIMIAKLSLIPWYVLNFIIGYVFVSIFFNPFMMIAIPVIIALLCSSTYMLMLTTSIGDVAYFVYSLTKKRWTIEASLLFAVILLFVFCLDVVGSIILYNKSKKISDQPEPTPLD